MKCIPSTDDILQNTVLNADALHTLYQEAKSVGHLTGNVAEVGVYRGGSAVCITSALPHKTLHAFESFKGLSHLSGEKDCVRTHKNMRGHAEGDFRLRKPNPVRVLLRKHSIVLHEGEFSLTCEAVKNESFSFVHCDVDTYNATLECLIFFYPRLVAGGKMLVHDYGWLATPGVQHAVNEFLYRTHGEVALLKGNYALITKD